MRVGVIGSGSIGPDLAYGFVSALGRVPGAKVWLHDIKESALQAGLERIHGYVKKGLAKGKLTPKAAAAVDEKLVTTTRLADLAECDYVLEAASEDLGVKQKILAELEAVVRPDCLVGFATSGLPRARIAAEAKHPGRCFVNHPFFPAWRSLPIEVVLSGDAALGARMLETLKRLGKVPVVTADVACFAADDIFCNYISEAVRIVAEGVASPAQVDAIVDGAIGGGGPFAVMDGTRGNLLTKHCQELMRDAPTGSKWFEPPALLAERGATPWHDKKKPGDPRADAALAGRVLDRILAVLIGRTCFVVERGICEAGDLDWLTRMALGFKKGLLELAADLGPARARDLCVAYAAAHPGFEVPAGLAAGRLPGFRRDVRVSREDELAVVRVHRPEVKNALSGRTMAELDAVFEELGRDDAVKGIVLTSYDGSFAGAEIGELAALPDTEACREMCRRGQRVLARIAALAKPVVAAVDGPVLGGGAELAMAAHARVVGPDLALGQPEVNLGIIPGYGGTQRLPRLIGVERGLDLLRTGRTVGAADAAAWGWATGEPSRDVVGAAKALIRRHLQGEVRLAPVEPDPVSLPTPLPTLGIGHHSLAIDRILVDVVRRGLARPLAEGLEIEADGFARCKATVDMDIGMKNFIQNGPRTPAQFLHE